MNEELSERVIRDGYWYHRPDEQFPPSAIQQPEEYDGGERACVFCTQTSLSATKQKRLVERWCAILPQLNRIRTIWFCSKVSQNLFEAACAMPALEGLYVKWSSIKDLQCITNASLLRYFHLGSSSQVESIAPLAGKESLQWLEVENINRISDLSPIGRLQNLVGLSIEGSMWATQSVTSLEPLSRLSKLRFLSLANLKAKDGSLKPLHALSNLRTLRFAKWWSASELRELSAALPQVKLPT